MFVEKYYPIGEVQASLLLAVTRGIAAFTNSYVRDYILACYRQAVQYYRLYEQSEVLVSPLVAFYSALNLSKVAVLLRRKDYGITKESVDKLFGTHGASSTTIDKVALDSRGTFAELSKEYWLARTTLRRVEYTLSELYRSVPDLYEQLEQLGGVRSAYIPVQLAEDFQMSVYRAPVSVSDVGLVTEKRFAPIADQALLPGWRRMDIEDWSWYVRDIGSSSYADKLSVYIRNLHFSMDQQYYLNTDELQTIEQHCAIYLVLLKYSSLVRYQPRAWVDKLDSEESLVIDRAMSHLLLKLWVLYEAEFTGRGRYVV
jgi:hypothetical protein